MTASHDADPWTLNTTEADLVALSLGPARGPVRCMTRRLASHRRTETANHPAAFFLHEETFEDRH